MDVTPIEIAKYSDQVLAFMEFITLQYSHLPGS